MTKVLVAVAATFLLAVLAAPAALAEVPTSDSPAANDSACVIGVTSQTKRCFSTFRSAMAHATGGRITDAPRDAGTASTDPRLQARLNGLDGTSTASAQDDVVLSIEYEHIGFGGRGWIVSAPYGCDESNDPDWSLPYVGDSLNDQISSYEGFNNCLVRHYEDPGFGGAFTPLRPGDDDMRYDGFNDLTSSISWH